MRYRFLGVVSLALLSCAVPAAPAQAQQIIGYDGWGQPICAGPLGPGPCAAVQQYLMQQEQMRQQQMQQMQQPMPGQFGMPPSPGAPGIAGLPGAGLLTQDGQIVAAIGQRCNGEPRCMAAAWGAVEIQRCRNGFGVPGGCFGPNGEIMRVVNRVLPHNLRPNVILRNVENDIRHGPGPNNEICRHTPLC